MVRTLLAFLTFVSASILAETYGDLIPTRIISVYDGDTFKVDIDHVHPAMGKAINVRVMGVDTPEIRGKCPEEKQKAIAARDFVREVLSNASFIQLKNISRDKYFRIGAYVYVDGEYLHDMLIARKLGVPYGEANWCEK